MVSCLLRVYKMGLYLWLVFVGLLVDHSGAIPFNLSGSNPQVLCSEMADIEFATLKDVPSGNRVEIYVECMDGYDLVGGHKLLCDRGVWESGVRPRCVPSLCQPPPNIDNGKMLLEGAKTSTGMFKKGTVVTYMCDRGYKLLPPDSKYRVCEKRIWTGAPAGCFPYEPLSGCKEPRGIDNGYYVHEKTSERPEDFVVGQRIHYSCNSGFALRGSPVQQCLDDGSWSPRIQPTCDPQMPENELLACPPLSGVHYVVEKVLRGEKTEYGASAGTEVAMRCMDGYKNVFSSLCQPVLLKCSGGVWMGEDVPSCVPVKECLDPPSLIHGAVFSTPTQGNAGRLPRYFVGMEMTYQCFPGYELRGSRVLKCMSDGCWEPFHHPSCHPISQIADLSQGGTLLVSVATAAGVMLMLLAVCVAVVCRRRKLWTRRPLAQAVGAAVPLAPAAAAAVLNDPDRLALIAFADGVHAGQAGLPTYEEAIRERVGSGGGTVAPTGLFCTRPPRPHWPPLGSARRLRPITVAAPQQPELHVTRQGSSASHSASLRSGSAGDPMGSTDTMTPSEVSTNITLDTVSSHSGSHPASCRAICGSLASFDTSSVVNTEGAPLLEENEAEETLNADSESLGLDHRSMADNGSFKYRRASPDLA